MGESGQSCTSVCAAHDGFDAESLGVLGTTAQGGSSDECAAVLTALLGETDVDVSVANEDVGIGCHVFGDEPGRWWTESPAFTPDSSLANARIACSCNG
jgi:hypothetical protein